MPVMLEQGPQRQICVVRMALCGYAVFSTPVLRIQWGVTSRARPYRLPGTRRASGTSRRSPGPRGHDEGFVALDKVTDLVFGQATLWALAQSNL